MPARQRGDLDRQAQGASCQRRQGGSGRAACERLQWLLAQLAEGLRARDPAPAAGAPTALLLPPAHTLRLAPGAPPQAVHQKDKQCAELEAQNGRLLREAKQRSEIIDNLQLQLDTRRRSCSGQVRCARCWAVAPAAHLCWPPQLLDGRRTRN